MTSASTQLAKNSSLAINLRDHLATLKGTTIAHMTMRTPVKLTGGKKNPQQGRVEKVTTTPVLIFNDANVSVYENKVNRQRIKEGKQADFKAGAPSWKYEPVAPGVVSYTSKAGVTENYLKVIKMGKQRTHYLLDGKPVAKESIEGFPPYRAPANQGVENTVDFRVVKLQNIVRLSVKGEKLQGDFFFE